ncbi:MAG: sensor histidine kinase [Candidatus Acidiferrum sp.]
MEHRKRLFIGLLFGASISLVGWAVDIYFGRIGISADDIFLNDFLLGIIAALLAYAWVTLQAERHLREQTRQGIKQEAVLEERNRMAREFHDTVAQRLAGIVLQLEASEDFLSGVHPAAQKCLLQAAALAREGLAEAREAVWNLRPKALRGNNLPGAIARLAKNLTEGTPIRVAFAFGGSAREVPGNIEKDVLRIGQEALNNVVKHAQASKVNVNLTLTEEQLQLEVEDDGLGFATEIRSVDARFGLTSMHERAKALGGTCQIYSQPGQGTKVQTVVPVSAGTV